MSESARLVQLLETFFESTLGYIDVVSDVDNKNFPSIKYIAFFYIH